MTRKLKSAKLKQESILEKDQKLITSYFRPNNNNIQTRINWNLIKTTIHTDIQIHKPKTTATRMVFAMVKDGIPDDVIVQELKERKPHGVQKFGNGVIFR